MKTSLTEEDIKGLIVEEHDYFVGNKTTIVVLTLRNGFEVVGTSACVDPENYKHEVGKKYARQRAIDKVWELAGYALQDRLVLQKRVDEALVEATGEGRTALEFVDGLLSEV